MSTAMRHPEIVVITGASARVGRAVASEFARHGAWIGLLARNGETLRASQEVEQLSGRALILVADVADAAAIERAADEVETEFGPIDVWINNAIMDQDAAAKKVCLKSKDDGLLSTNMKDFIGQIRLGQALEQDVVCIKASSAVLPKSFK